MTFKSIVVKYRRMIVVFMYAAMVCVSYFGAFYFRFEFSFPEKYVPLVIRTLPVMVVIKLSVFYFFGLFSGLWRYVSINDLWQILRATVVSSIIFVLYGVFVFRLAGFPRSIFILDWMICVGLVAGTRLASRSLREVLRPRVVGRAVKGLIVGAGEAGILVLRELKANFNIDVVGFIDDDPTKRGMSIHGKKVLGNKDDIKNTIDTYDIEEIIIAMPKEKGSVIRDIVTCCSFPGVKVKIVPGMFQILSGEKEIKVREVRPEDLLGRETVEIDKEDIAMQLKEKVVLVTGAAGSIGSEIVKQIIQFSPKQIILADHNENDLYFLERELVSKYPAMDFAFLAVDITEVSVLKHLFSGYMPQVVFHAAAFKHVPLMESNPASAVKNNILGSRNLIYASDHYKVESFVLISSDKAVNPTNIMGATKRITEMIMQAKSFKSRTKFIAVRFGNVLGSKGSVVPLFKKQIEESRKVTVTHPDATRFFMSIKEAVQLVLQASAIGNGGEIFVLDMGEQIKILDFAKNLIALSGLIPEEDVRIEFIGLRPGEKLYEQPLHDEEKDLATRHEKIFITSPQEFDIRRMLQHVKELGYLANIMDNNAIIDKLKEVVPGFKQTNS